MGSRGEILVSKSLCFVASVMMVIQMPLVSVFALELGASTLELGLVGGLGPAVYAVIALLAGPLVSRVGEPRAITYSLLVMGSSYFMFSLSRSVAELAVVNMLSTGAYALFWPAVESLLSKKGGSASGFAFSWSLGGLSASLAVSPLLSAPKRLVFQVLAALSLASALTSLTLKGDSGEGNETIKGILRGIADIPDAWAGCLIYATVQGAVFVFYPAFLELSGLPEMYASLCFFSLIGARTLTFLVYPKLGVRSGESLLSGLIALSLVSLVPHSREVLHLALTSLFVGVGAGLTYTGSLEKAFYSDEDVRASYMGLFESFIGWGYAAGPVIAGLVSEYSLYYSFYATGIMALATALLLVTGRVSARIFKKSSVTQAAVDRDDIISGTATPTFACPKR